VLQAHSPSSESAGMGLKQQGSRGCMLLGNGSSGELSVEQGVTSVPARWFQGRKFHGCMAAEAHKGPGEGAAAAAQVLRLSPHPLPCQQLAYRPLMHRSFLLGIAGPWTAPLRQLQPPAQLPTLRLVHTRSVSPLPHPPALVLLSSSPHRTR
jgi:hypothetical protein